LKVFAALRQFANKDLIAWPSAGLLAAVTGGNKNRAISALDRLQAESLISPTGGRRRGVVTRWKLAGDPPDPIWDAGKAALTRLGKSAVYNVRWVDGSTWTLPVGLRGQLWQKLGNEPLSETERKLWGWVQHHHQSFTDWFAKGGRLPAAPSAARERVAQRIKDICEAKDKSLEIANWDAYLDAAVEEAKEYVVDDLVAEEKKRLSLQTSGPEVELPEDLDSEEDPDVDHDAISEALDSLAEPEKVAL